LIVGCNYLSSSRAPVGVGVTGAAAKVSAGELTTGVAAEEAAGKSTVEATAEELTTEVAVKESTTAEGGRQQRWQQKDL
jgi:hypothetical protein